MKEPRYISMLILIYKSAFVLHEGISVVEEC